MELRRSLFCHYSIEIASATSWPRNDRRGSASLILLAVGLLTARGLPLTAQGRYWSLADRTIVSDGAIVTAVAAGLDRVFACGPGGLLLYDPLVREWSGPYFPPLPEALARVSSAMIDPVDGSLWLAAGTDWLHYLPVVDSWEQGSLSGIIGTLAFDADIPASGVYFRVAARWYLMPRGSNLPAPAPAPARMLRPATVEEALRDNPGLALIGNSLLLDGRRQPARLLSVARDPGGRGWWLATDGVGLLFLPFGATTPDRMMFGLPSRSVEAVYAAPGGVWAATDVLGGTPAAVTFLPGSLVGARWNFGPPATGLPFTRVARITAMEQDLWLATDGGLIRMPINGDRIERYDEGRGLPDSRVYAVLARQGRIVAGTARGLAEIGDSGRMKRIAPSFGDPVNALEMDGDTLWVGTRLGLFAVRQGALDLQLPVALDQGPAFRAPVLAIAWLGDTLVALNVDRLLYRVPATGTWSLGPTISTELGSLRTMVVYADGLFVAGDRGIGFVRVNTSPSRVILVPDDLPSAPRDLAVDNDYLWVATASGLVRWNVSVVGP